MHTICHSTINCQCSIYMLSSCDQTCIKNTIYTCVYIPFATSKSTSSVQYTCSVSVIKRALKIPFTHACTYFCHCTINCQCSIYKLSLCDQTCIKIIRYTWDHRLDAIVLSLAHTKNNIIMINVKAV